MVKAAYGSGKPAYGVGAGNATMVIDETANIEEAARNTRISKTNDHGSGCSARWQPPRSDASIYDAMLKQLQLGRRVSRQRAREAHCSSAPTGMPRGTARPTRSRGRRRSSPPKAGFAIPDDKTFLLVEESHIGKAVPLFDREAGHRARDVQVSRVRHGARHGAADLRDRRQGSLQSNT